MLTERANVICLLRILEEYSDAEHILPMREIIAKLKTIYDLTIDRRTVYSAMELLMALGYDISIYAENRKGYFLRERTLESSEVRLLTDAVYSFPYMSERQSLNLVDKLQGLLSQPQRRQYRHLKPIRIGKKTQNQSVFLNVELLEDAISRQVQISFDYMEYGLDKKLHNRRERKYIVEPYTMVCTNEHYYLICRYVEYERVSFYRIDLMKNISLTQTPMTRMDNWRKFVEQSVYAFTGEPEQIKLQCKNYIIGDVLSKFGTDVHIAKDGSENFIVSFRAAPFGIRFWALQYLPHVEVLEPEHLRVAIIESLRQSPYFDMSDNVYKEKSTSLSSISKKGTEYEYNTN